MNQKLRAAHKAALIVTAMQALWACGKNSSGNSGSQSFDAAVHIQIQGAQQGGPPTDSIVVEVSGAGMELQHVVFPAGYGEIRLQDLPAGQDRTFEVTLFADSGQAVQGGEVVADLDPGMEASVVVDLNPLVAYLSLDVPLGVDGAGGVEDGWMRLVRGTDTVLERMAGSGPIRHFLAGPLVFGDDWKLDLVLLSATGDTLQHAMDTLDIREGGSWPMVLSLRSLLGGAKLSLLLDTIPELQGTVLLPGSRTRAPSRRGEVRFTEILANPKTSGNDWEWMELVNVTPDTMMLSGCLVRKDAASTSASTMLTLDSSVRIAPGRFYLLGRDSISMANGKYRDFTLGNSGQGLRLDCGSQLVDSLQYFMPDDATNPWPLYVGKSMQLPLDSLGGIGTGTRWCAGIDTVKFNGFHVLGSPGRDGNCQ